MKRHAAELLTRDPERFFHHDRVFLNNPVVMQGMGLAPLVVLATSGQNALMLAVAVALLLTPSRMLACLLSHLFPLREEHPANAELEKKLLPQGGGREEMLYRLTNLTKGDEIASFASIVLETAQSPLCKKLRQGAVDSLTLYAGRMLENLRAQGEQNLKIVLSGGLFKSDCFRAQALEAMEKLAPVVVNTVSPALGGVRIAQKLG